jgi:hypothetical protein
LAPIKKQCQESDIAPSQQGGQAPRDYHDLLERQNATGRRRGFALTRGKRAENECFRDYILLLY